MATNTLPQSPPPVTPAKFADVLAAIVYQMEATHFHLNATAIPADSAAFRKARNADETITRAARLAMETLMEAGYDRAPMCQPWPAVMPEGWRGPTCWAENDAPAVPWVAAAAHEPEPCEYPLEDCDTFERTGPGLTVDEACAIFDPSAFDMQEEWSRR